MKQILPIILTVLLFISCKKENEETSPIIQTDPTYFTFNGVIGGNDNSTLVSSDDNIVICGNYNNNICILKICKDGNQIWRKDIYSGYGSESSAIIESSDHNFFICGNTLRNQFISRSDILLIKTNSDGDTLWTKVYGGIKDDYGCQILKSTDGNIVICCFSYSYTSESCCDIYLIKVNTNGDTLWTKTYLEEGQEIPFHFMQTQNGEFLVTGKNDDFDYPFNDLYLLKIDANGDKIWDKKNRAHMGKYGFSAVELANGDLLICGNHNVNWGGQVLLVKTDNLGNVYWEKEIGDSNLSENGNSVKQNLDGTFTIAGSSYDINTTSDDIILLKVDQNGNQIWFKKFGSSAINWGINLIKDNDDDNIVTGTTFSSDSDESNNLIFMTKVDNNGNFK